MVYKQIIVKSLINKITKKDYLFKGKYTVDPYQNCEFACSYCDSSFDPVIYVKSNGAQIFEKELETLPQGKIIIGSVHDPYQKAEEEFKITQKILKIIVKKGFSCNILTKSDLILRDINLLKKIKNCNVTISITSLDENVTNLFEKNVISSQRRLELIKTLNKNKIKTSLAIIPIIPYITDKELDLMVKKANEHNSKNIVYKHLELKGDQKRIFLNLLEEHYPDLVENYSTLYSDSFSPNKNYARLIKEKMEKIIFSFYPFQQ